MEKRSINILPMRLGAFTRPFEHGRRGHQNFRRALRMKTFPFYPTDTRGFSALCVAQPKLEPIAAPACVPVPGESHGAATRAFVFLLSATCPFGSLLLFPLSSFPQRKRRDHFYAARASLSVSSWQQRRAWLRRLVHQRLLLLTTWPASPGVQRKQLNLPWTLYTEADF